MSFSNERGLSINGDSRIPISAWVSTHLVAPLTRLYKLHSNARAEEAWEYICAYWEGRSQQRAGDAQETAPDRLGDRPAIE